MIKIFEDYWETRAFRDNNPKWGSADKYLLVDVKDITNKSGFPNGRFLPCEIVSVDVLKNPSVKFSNGSYGYIAWEDVIRVLEDDEIEDFKLKLVANKYNI